MRKGRVEYSHYYDSDTMRFRFIQSERDEETGKKELPDLAYEIPMEEFIKDFLIEVEGIEGSPQKVIETFMQNTSLLRDVYNPENSKTLEAYLGTKESRDIEDRQPAFPFELSLKWDEEKGKMEFVMIGMENDIERALHGALRASVPFEHSFMIVASEKIEAAQQQYQLEMLKQQSSN